MSRKISLKKLAGALPAKIDLFICAASFEQRSLSVASALRSGQVDRAIVFTDSGELGGLARPTTLSITSLFTGKANVVPFDLTNPLDMGDKIMATLRALPFRANTVIDVTTFTHEALLILLRVLQILNEGGELIGVYNGATDYGVGLRKEEKWLTKGVSEIRSVLGFSGKSRPTQGQHLIVLAGFELERAERIIDAYEPGLLSIGLGDPLESINPDLFNVNKWFHERLSEKYSDVKQFTFSCDNALHTRDSILDHVSIYPALNTQVAPMNTKISTVGVALAAMEDTTIQICYANPAIYNTESYSSPSTDAYIFSIALPQFSI